MSANDPIADYAWFRFDIVMTKLFYGSYVICVLLALLQLVMFLSAYSSGDIAIYHGAIIVTSGGTSLLLLTSIFLSLKARIVALLVFATATISVYVWEMSVRPVDPTTMSSSEGLLHGVLFLLFVLAPVVGLASGASLMRRFARRKE